MLWKTPWVKGDDQIHHCKIENRRMSPEAFHKPMDPLKFFEIIYLNALPEGKSFFLPLFITRPSLIFIFCSIIL